MTRLQRQRRRKLAAATVSALVHGVVLTLLARYSPAVQSLAVAARDFQIELVAAAPMSSLGQSPRPTASPQTAPSVTPRTPRRAPHQTDVQTTAPFPLATRAAQAKPDRQPQMSRNAPPPPQPATTRAASGPGAAGSTAGANPGAVGALPGTAAGSDSAADASSPGMRGALRTSVGCDDPDFFDLSKAERAVCARQFGVQAAIGARQYVDPIRSAKVRNAYDKAREACDRLNHYATPLDDDREHSAKAPGNWGFGKLNC